MLKAPGPRAARQGMYTSAQFAAQARSDLRQAQSIARASASGDVLGTAMFLAQQAMEKQFKSALLRVGEAIEVGLEEGFYRKTLNHAVHQHPARFYQECIDGISLPKSPKVEGIARGRMGMLERPGKVWDPKFYRPEIKFLLFQYYLGASMTPEDARRLDAHLDAILEKIGCGGPSEHRFSASRAGGRPGEDMDEGIDNVISDREVLQRHRDGFAGMPHNAFVARSLENVLGDRLDIISEVSRGHGLFAGGTCGGDAALMILDYGVFAVSLCSPTYVYLVPHYVYGRYPTRLPDGRISTDVYASRRDSVLARLFVNVQHDYDQMRRVCEGIGVLREAWRGSAP